MAGNLVEAIIINDILRRLPTKTLLRCTCVCKSWYTLITSPKFIFSHLKYSSTVENNAPSLLVIRRCIRSYERYSLYLDDEPFTSRATFQFPFKSINSYFTIVGSCNGLLCLSDDRVYYMHTVILWNPSIKRSVLLPTPNLIYNSHGSFIQSLGFGFDTVTNDHKVVRITYVDSSRSTPQVELYKLSTGLWQDMSYLELQHVIYNRSRQASVNGACHWIARCMDCYNLVVLFDMSNEAFREIILPPCLANDDVGRSRDLAVCIESIARDIRWFEAGQCCVWVMVEYGVVDSWTKMFNFDRQGVAEQIMRPLCVRKHGEVLAVGQEGRLISCDVNRGGEVGDIEIRGSNSEDYKRSVHVERYVTSLVLLERGTGFPDVITCSKLPSMEGNDCDSVGSYGTYGEQINLRG